MKLGTALLLVLLATSFAGAEEEPTLEELPGGTPESAKISEITTKLSMANALIRAGNAEKALDVIAEVETLDLFGNYSTECLYYRGFAYNALGDLEASESTYRQALESSPGNTSVMLGLAQTLLDAAKYDDAEAIFLEVLAAEPDEPSALTGMGYLSILAGDGAAARDYLERALAADPETVLARSYLGLLAMQEGDYETAKQYLEKAVALDPRNVTANYNLASIYFMEEDYASAVEYYSAVLARVPDDYETRFYLALSLEQVGMYAEAREQVRMIIESGALIPGVVELESRLAKETGGN